MAGLEEARGRRLWEGPGTRIGARNSPTNQADPRVKEGLPVGSDFSLPGISTHPPAVVPETPPSEHPSLVILLQVLFTKQTCPAPPPPSRSEIEADCLGVDRARGRGNVFQLPWKEGYWRSGSRSVPPSSPCAPCSGWARTASRIPPGSDAPFTRVGQPPAGPVLTYTLCPWECPPALVLPQVCTFFKTHRLCPESLPPPPGPTFCGFLCGCTLDHCSWLAPRVSLVCPSNLWAP